MNSHTCWRILKVFFFSTVRRGWSQRWHIFRTFIASTSYSTEQCLSLHIYQLWKNRHIQRQRCHRNISSVNSPISEIGYVHYCRKGWKGVHNKPYYPCSLPAKFSQYSFPQGWKRSKATCDLVQVFRPSILINGLVRYFYQINSLYIEPLCWVGVESFVHFDTAKHVLIILN